jgi:exosortase
MNPMPATNNRFNALLALGTLVLFMPTWVWLGEAWLSNPYYSHGPLVLIISLYLAWTQRHVIASEAKQSPNQNSETASRLLEIIGWIIIFLALGVHLWAMLWRAYYISAMMIPLAFLGLLITLYGWHSVKRFWFPLAFLILMIPLPLAERFGPPLEGFAASSATTLVQWLGVAAQNEGAQVFLPNSTFTVGIPCGGLRSIIAIITLVVLLAYIVDGHAWARGLLLLASIPIAIAANTIRIALLFVIANSWGSDIAMNYFHDWSSPVLFLGVVVMMFALAKILRTDQVRWQVVLPNS